MRSRSTSPIQRSLVRSCQAENRPQRQRRGDRQRRVARLTATRGAGRGLPRRNRCFREPDGQAPALAQRDVIGSPIRHSVPLLRDVMTAILIRFERHGGCPGSGTGPGIPSNPRRLNDRSVQQGPSAYQHTARCFMASCAALPRCVSRAHPPAAETRLRSSRPRHDALASDKRLRMRSLVVPDWVLRSGSQDENEPIVIEGHFAEFGQKALP